MAADYVERSREELGSMMAATIQAAHDTPRVLARQMVRPVEFDEDLDDMRRSLEEKEAERKEALELARRADRAGPCSRGRSSD